MSVTATVSDKEYRGWAKDEVRRVGLSGNNAAIREAAFMSVFDLRVRLSIDDKAARILRAECRKWIREQWDFEDETGDNPFGYWKKSCTT